MKATFLYILIFLNYFSLLGCQVKEDNLSFAGRLQAVSDENIYRNEGYYIWDTSIIKGEDGKYHLIYSRWDKKFGFRGWLIFSEIVHAVSDSPVGPWEHKGVLLQGRGKGHWDQLSVHNPMLKVFNGKYYLYYNSTCLADVAYSDDDLIALGQQGPGHPLWSVARNNQRVGVAVASSLDGPWERMDKPLIEPSGPITTITNNPAITEKDGTYYLIVKGDKPDETRFMRNQAMALSKSPTGPFYIQEKAVIDYLDTEDVALWYDSKRGYFYAVFHTNEEGGFIGMVSSPDGISWGKANEYVITTKKILKADGSYLKPQRLERPFVYVEDNEPQVLALAAKKGDDSFLIFIPIDNQSEE